MSLGGGILGAIDPGASPTNQLSRDSVQRVLAELTAADTRNVFEAIRLAKPGGLGSVAEADVNHLPSAGEFGLVEAMERAADHDLVARQYANGFEDVFGFGVDQLVEGRQIFESLSQSIVYAHVAMMAKYPDGLIARKVGSEAALHSQMLAAKAVEKLRGKADGELGIESWTGAEAETELETGTAALESQEAFWDSVADLDFWLRSDGHRRNPGTTADWVAASLFVALQRELIS